MGQNHPKHEWLQYSSRDFFQQQIDFYKWRSDPQVNIHICRVNFQLQQSVQDRQKLTKLLQTRFQLGEYVSLNDILKLAQTKSQKMKEELMTFQNYVCTLYDFQQRLTLAQTLHSLQIMFSGYEVLYAKKRKLKVKLIYLFITNQGQLRCWFNKDYKSNDIGQDPSEVDYNSPLLSSEMAIIKKIVELGQKLVSNHTEYLHFSRMFRSYMERDILQNWNFSNARKLINSYAYTYKINLPNNLRQTLKRRVQSAVPITTSINYYSQLQSSISSCKNSKNDLISTGDIFLRREPSSSNPTSSRKQNQQRPVSLSDYSCKKSEQQLNSSFKLHSKKFSSIDLKNIQDRSKHYQSPKMSRSQLVSNHSHSQYKPKTKQQTPTPQIGNKMRRQRQFAFVGQSPETKMHSTQILTNYCHSHNLTQHENGQTNTSKIQENKIKNKQNMNHTTLKQNQIIKQKKKLEKKAVAVSKYITFYQETKQPSYYENSNSYIQPSFTEQEKPKQKIKISTSPHFGPNKERPIQQQFTKYKVTQKKLQTQKKPIFNFNSPTPKVRFQNLQNNVSMIQPFRGKTQQKTCPNNESHRGSHNSHQNNRMCYTIKTLNKLVNNSDVSLHQSIGSFSSMNQSEESGYMGVLAKMGRSVDILNLPSNKNMSILTKKQTTNTHLNKSINN